MKVNEYKLEDFTIGDEFLYQSIRDIISSDPDLTYGKIERFAGSAVMLSVQDKYDKNTHNEWFLIDKFDNYYKIVEHIKSEVN